MNKVFKTVLLNDNYELVLKNTTWSNSKPLTGVNRIFFSSTQDNIVAKRMTSVQFLFATVHSLFSAALYFLIAHSMSSGKK